MLIMMYEQKTAFAGVVQGMIALLKRDILVYAARGDELPVTPTMTPSELIRALDSMASVLKEMNRAATRENFEAQRLAPKVIRHEIVHMTMDAPKLPLPGQIVEMTPGKAEPK